MSISAVGVGAPTTMHAMSGASGAGSPPRQKMTGLFDSMDTAGSGSVTQAQFNAAFATKGPPAVFQNAGADAIWSSLDPNGTGSVRKDSFVSTMSGLMGSLRAAPSDQSTASSANAAASLQSLQAVGRSSGPYTPGTLLSQTV